MGQERDVPRGSDADLAARVRAGEEEAFGALMLALAGIEEAADDDPAQLVERKELAELVWTSSPRPRAAAGARC